MKYNIIAHGNNKSFHKVNLDKLDLFKNSLNDSSCGYDIKDIDEFTMNFEDMEQLRKTLILGRALPYTFFSSCLYLSKVHKRQSNNISLDLLYKKDKHMYDNPEEVIKYIMSRYYKGDFEFVKALADNYKNTPGLTGIANDVYVCARISISQGIHCNDFSTTDRNGDNLLTRFIKLLLFEHSNSVSGHVIYKDKVNYCYLHSLINFINKYNDTKEKEKNGDEEKKKPVKIRKRVKEDNNNGQISFF